MSPAFLAASLVLAVTPGPGVLFIVTRALTAGRRQALLSVAGVGLGNGVNGIAAGVGVAALLAAWPAALQVLQLAGAAVLLWMAWTTWRSEAPNPSLPVEPASQHATLRSAFVVSLLNPKTLLFFAAFLPPFVDPAAPRLPQMLVLAGTFVLIAAATDSLYALAASRLKDRMAGMGRLARAGRPLAALVYALLAVLALRPL